VGRDLKAHRNLGGGNVSSTTEKNSREGFLRYGFMLPTSGVAGRRTGRKKTMGNSRKKPDSRVIDRINHRFQGRGRLGPQK